MATIPTTEPTEAVAGDTWKWTRGQLSDYPIADGWKLTYAFRGPDTLDVEQLTGANGEYAVVVAATDTERLPAGVYQWAAYVTKDTERYRVDTGSVRVFADLVSAAAVVPFEERELALVEAAILDITESGISSFQLNGRATNKLDLPALHKRRTSLLWATSARRNGTATRPVQVRFGRA